jgi:selenide, water dikinase
MIPIQQNVVLVGAGNAHLVFVKRLHMQPAPGVAVALVNDSAVVPYSAMVPGHIAGEYAWDDITIDLVRLCRCANVRFVQGQARAVDTANRTVAFADRAPLAYDALSLGLGSVPAMPSPADPSAHSWPMRPLIDLVDRIHRLECDLLASPRPFRLAIVGGGASGCELALAIQHRFRTFADFRITLLQSDECLVPQLAAKAGAILRDVLRQRGIDLHLGARVVSADSGTISLATGETHPFDVVLWATHAAPPGILQNAGLPLNAAGFLLVNDTLQSTGDSSVFGTGDCIAHTSYPDLVKNGVHAVRQGRVLFDNLLALLRDQPLRPFRPQSHCLGLMNLADGRALLHYGKVVTRGKVARRLKERIDRAWIAKFVDLAPAPMADTVEPMTPQMRCGGCGSKVSPDVLSAVLKRLKIDRDSRVVLGVHDGEDAAAFRMQPGLFGTDPLRLLEIQTFDYFKAFVDDPYLFGRIAAINALSDLYAMNARPFTALAIATLPVARGPIQEALLFEMLSGAMRSLAEAGVILSGGHTTEGDEMALGFTVTGHAEDYALFQKKALQVGDRLILTKPLGTGALLAAWMQARCRARWFEPMINSMLLSNGPAAAVLREFGVTACTDVTGFGLAGHLLEMLNASRVAARIDGTKIELYDGFTDVAVAGILSTMHPANARAAARIRAAMPPPDWFFDPQTSGGLLAGVQADVADDVADALRGAGFPRTSIIGEVVAKDPERAAIEWTS